MQSEKVPLGGVRAFMFSHPFPFLLVLATLIKNIFISSVDPCSTFPFLFLQLKYCIFNTHFVKLVYIS